jgi:signal transduction histidine kinase
MTPLSIRNQILVPLIAIQSIAVVTVAVTAARLAASRSEHHIIGRLNGVISALYHANFPYTEGVLARMRALSGAHFAVFTNDGRVTAATLPALETLPPALQVVRPFDRLDSLGESSALVLEGTRYFAVPLRTQGSAHDRALLVLYPETNWRQARWEAATPPLAVGLGTLLIMAAVTSWIAHRISRRIRAVQQQVARIAAGELEGFDPGPRGDEVQDLASSINRMCGQLKQMQATIRRSERTQLLAQLAAGLAHQLRNSLTGARMSIQLHTKRFPPQKGDQTLDVALRQLAMTEEQVQGILSLGRVERLPHEQCDLRRMLADVTLLVHPVCDHAKVHLRHSEAAAPIHVTADLAGLRAAVLNLTMNAVEAAGPGGEVSLGASAEHGEVTIDVCDTGPGPAPEVAETLLEPFVTSKPEGVGLGLALAQRVAAEHGGSLSWTREGRLTHFRLTLANHNGTAEDP